MKNREHLHFQKLMQSGPELDGETASRLARHLESCSQCREYAAFHAYLVEALPRLAPQAALPAPALQKKAASIIYKTRRSKMIAMTLQTTHKLGLAAALTLVLVLGLSWAVNTLIPPPTPAVLSQTSPTPADTAAPQPSHTAASPILEPTLDPTGPDHTPTPSMPQPALITQPNRGAIEHLALAPGGEWLAISSGNTVCLHAAKNYTELWCAATEEALISQVLSLSFSPSADRVAAGLLNGKIVVFDRASSAQLQVLDTGREVFAIAWSPDGRTIASSSPSFFIQVWDVTSGENLQRLRSTMQGSSSLAWSPDGSRLAAVTLHGGVEVWETRQYEQVLVLTIDDPRPGGTIAWAPDGSTIFSTAYLSYGCGEGCEPPYIGWVYAWDASSGEMLYEVEVGDPLVSLAVSPDGRYVAAGGEAKGKIVVLAADTGSLVAETGGDPHKGLVWQDAEHLLFANSAAYDPGDAIVIWNPVGGTATTIVFPQYAAYTQMTWLPGTGRLLLSSVDNKLIVWDWQSGREQILDIDGRLSLFALSPDGIHLAVPASNGIRIYNLQTGSQVSTDSIFAAPEGAGYSNLLWSPDGSRLAGILSQQREVMESDGGMGWFWELEARVWDAQSGELLWSMPNGDGRGGFPGLVWSPDSSQLALGWYRNGSQRLLVWDMTQLVEIQAQARPYWVGDLWWPEPGKLFLHQADKVEVLDPHSLEMQAQFSTAHARGFSIHNGLLAAGYSNSVKFYNIDNLQDSGVMLPGMGSEVQDVRFSPDGEVLAVLTEGGMLSIWNVRELAGALP
jgi:WD40 repeat protein